MSIDSDFEKLVSRKDFLEARLDAIQESASKQGLAWKIPVIQEIAAILRFRQVIATKNELNRVERRIDKISEQFKAKIPEEFDISQPEIKQNTPLLTKEMKQLAKQYRKKNPNLSKEEADLAARCRFEQGLTDEQGLKIAGLRKNYEFDPSTTIEESLLAAAYHLQFFHRKPSEAFFMAKMDLELRDQSKISPQMAQLTTIYRKEHSLSLPRAMLAASLQVEYQGQTRKDRRIALIAEQLLRESVDKNQALLKAEQLLAKPESAGLTIDQAFLVILTSLPKGEDANLNEIIEEVKRFDRYEIKKSPPAKVTLSRIDKIKEFFGLNKWILITKQESKWVLKSKDNQNLDSKEIESIEKELLSKSCVEILSEESKEKGSLFYIDVLTILRLPPGIKKTLSCVDKIKGFLGLSKWVRIPTGNKNGLEDCAYANVKCLEKAFNGNGKIKFFDANAIYPTDDAAKNIFQINKLMKKASYAIYRDFLSAPLKNDNSDENIPGIESPFLADEARRVSVDSDQTVIQSSERSDEDQEIISPSDESLSPKSGSQASIDRVEPNNNPIARLLEQINQSFRKQPGMSDFTDEEFNKIVLPFFFGILSLEDDGLTGLTERITAPLWISDSINKQFTPKILANKYNLQQILDLGMSLKSELGEFNLKEMDFEGYYDSDSYKTGNNLISRVKYEIEQSERGRIDHSPSPVSSPAPAGFIPSHHMHPTFDTRRLRKLWF